MIKGLRETEPVSTEEFVGSAGTYSRYLDFILPDGRIYGFPMAQLVNYVLDANAESDEGKNTPPDRLTIYFTSHDVVLFGWRLKRMVDRLKKETLSAIHTTQARYSEVAASEPVVNQIKVKAVGEK